MNDANAALDELKQVRYPVDKCKGVATKYNKL